MRNYNDEMWSEWVLRAIGNRTQAKAEVAGLCHDFSSEVNLETTIPVSSRPWIYKRLQKLWQYLGWEHDAPFSQNFMLSQKKEKTRKALLSPKSKAWSIIKKINENMEELIYAEGAAWIAGLWGSTGKQYFPKNGYYLLMRVRETPLSREIPKILLHNLDDDITISSRIRHGKREFTIRNIQAIHSFFVMTGLPLTALRLDEIVTLRSMKNKANKVVNCDSANIQKTLQAAERQIDFCKKAKKLGLEKKLSQEMGELINLRIAFPTMSLRELGSSLKKPVSKSTVEYRLKKIETFLENLSSGYY